MIKKTEILSYARLLKLLPTTIEKDYVLSWVLAGVGQNKLLQESLIFKGGTCLKKCFFENYRFSEDIDFTLIESITPSLEFFTDQFCTIARWVYQKSGIEIFETSIVFESYKNPRNNFCIQGKLHYKGPLDHRINFPKIKIDITTDEVVLLQPENRTIFHQYSDPIESSPGIKCYAFEEIFSEKIRALAQRARPRDLYDVVHLFKQNKLPVNRQLLNQVLKKKCQHVGIPFPSFSKLSVHPQKEVLVSEWENMLGHQIAQLKPLDFYWDQLPKVFKWLQEEQTTEPLLQKS